jgi:hypothetical protein
MGANNYDNLKNCFGTCFMPDGNREKEVEVGKKE